MRTGLSEILSQGHSSRRRLNSRLRRTRKSQYYSIDLEGLESRTLLATIPAATPTTAAPTNISTMMGNLGGVNASKSSSVVAVDPLDPSKLVAVWIDNDPTMFSATDGTWESVLEAAYSTDAGAQWNPLLVEPTTTLNLNAPAYVADGTKVDPDLLNPATSGFTVPYTYVSSPSLGFDDDGSFYILSEYTDSTGGSGALVLQHFKFNLGAPTTVSFGATSQSPNNVQSPSPYTDFNSNLKVIYQWVHSGTDDQAYDPTMSVDDNLSIIPSGVASPADAFSGNIYVSWASIDINTAIPIPDFNPNRITVEVSSDGGNDFSPATMAASTAINDGNGPESERDATPALTVSQGRLASESGVSGDNGITAGQVAVTFDDFGDGVIKANAITAGTDDSFGGATGGIAVGTTTAFSNTVNIANTSTLDSLEVTVNIIDSADDYLSLALVSPDGATYTLTLNEFGTDTGVGIGGADVGVETYSDNNIGSYAVGTTFTDTATRDIFDTTYAGTNGNAAPYIGDFRPENGETLDQFLAAQINNGDVNGTWKLETEDTNTSVPSSPQDVVNWSLSFGHGLNASSPVTVPGAVAGIYGAGPIAGVVGPANDVTSGVAVPSSPIDIGVGLVMTQDNTLGAYSPYEGRIYAAFVGYIDVTVDGFTNPTTNTDIFLTYSDNDGRTWSTPVEVNDDSGQVDGSSGGSEDQPQRRG